MKVTIATGALLLASGFAFAQQPGISQAGFYVGGSIGAATADVKDATNELNSAFASVGAVNSSTTSDDSDFSYKLFAGYKFNKNFALEGGYADLGKYTASGNALLRGSTINADGDVKAYAIFIDAVGILPASEEFAVFGKVGGAYTHTKANASASFAGFSASDNATSSKFVPKLGIGAQYYVTKAVALRAEYEYYFNVGDKNETGESDVQVFTVGLTYGF